VFREHVFEGLIVPSEILRIVVPCKRVILDEALECGIDRFVDGQSVQVGWPVLSYAAMFVDRDHLEKRFYSLAGRSPLETHLPVKLVGI
jgi:hypothetical protein